MTVCSQLQKVYTIYAHRLTDNFMITHLSWWWEDGPWGSHARNYNVNRYLLQTQCLHSDSSHAPWRLNLIGWSWATSERRETWAENYQRGRTGGPRDCVLMERTDKTTDCRGRQNGRKSSCTRKFFLPFCENVNNRHETQATWFYMQTLYSIIFQTIQW